MLQVMTQRVTAFLMAITAIFSGFLSEFFNFPAENEYFYGRHKRQSVNIILPENAEGSTRGVILFIHGGGWVAGDKSVYDASIREAAEKGYIGAAMNYRYVSSSVHMDDVLDDISAAVSKIRSVAEKNGIKVGKMLLTGGSAGAHLSLLYGFKRASVSEIEPGAVVSFCGPTDLTDPFYLAGNGLGSPKDVLALFVKVTGVKLSLNEYNSRSGNFEKFVAALAEHSPVNYVSEKTVPTVVAHGEKDDVVTYQNALDLVSLLSENGVRHDFVSFPNSGHGLDNDPGCFEKTNELLYEYAAEYLLSPDA